MKKSGNMLINISVRLFVEKESKKLINDKFLEIKKPHS